MKLKIKNRYLYVLWFYNIHFGGWPKFRRFKTYGGYNYSASFFIRKYCFRIDFNRKYIPLNKRKFTHPKQQQL